MAQPYRFYLLQYLQDDYQQLNADDKTQVDELLCACEMSEIVDASLSRRLGRHNNLEVWLQEGNWGQFHFSAVIVTAPPKTR